MSGTHLAFVSALLGFAALSACEPSLPPAGAIEIVADTIGDTVRVRTIAGQVWENTKQLEAEVTIGEVDGEDHYMLGDVSALTVANDGSIYVMDRLAKTVRVYGPDGSIRMSLGGEGKGPGELDGPDGGLAVLSDGRVLARDPGNQRVQVFSSEGAPLATWRLPTGLNMTDPLYVDSADNVWSWTVLDLGVPMNEWEFGYLRFNSRGDSLPVAALPVPDYRGAFVEAQREGSWSRNRVPFSPAQEIRVTPHGEFLNAVSETYSFDVLRGDGSVLRIGREYQPVPVAAGEAETGRRRVTRSLRRTDPEWTWNGPDIPKQKPAYRNVFVGRDGRYWVLTSEPGSETEEEAWDPEPGEPAPPRLWTEPVVFEVFERDGTYLGRVEAPDGVQTSPTPVFRGDNVWAVTEDELGIQKVVRFAAKTGTR